MLTHYVICAVTSPDSSPHLAHDHIMSDGIRKSKASPTLCQHMGIMVVSSMIPQTIESIEVRVAQLFDLLHHYCNRMTHEMTKHLNAFFQGYNKCSVIEKVALRWKVKAWINITIRPLLSLRSDQIASRSRVRGNRLIRKHFQTHNLESILRKIQFEEGIEEVLKV